MKLRYYLRGIGIGIVVATAICLCASAVKKNTKMTDAEVMARAEELGMTKGGTIGELAMTQTAQEEIESAMSSSEEVTNESVSSVEEPVTESEATTENMSLEEESEEASESVKEPATSQVQEETVEVIVESSETPESDGQNDSEEEYIVITVEKGNGSDTVARKLEKAGLVKNAVEYDKYLCANGYDRRISTGNHEIPKNASDEQIAKIICSIR